MADYKKLLDNVEDMILDGKTDTSLFEMRELLKELIKKDEIASYKKGDILLINGGTVILIKEIAGGKGWIVYKTLEQDLALMMTSGYLMGAKKVGHMNPVVYVKEATDE